MFLPDYPICLSFSVAMIFLSINIGYWTEKLQSISCFGSKEGCVKEFDAEGTADRIRELVEENKELKDIPEEILNCANGDEAMRILTEAEIDDAWEYIATKYTMYIKWALYAIRWAVMQYDKPKAIAA
jgi:hypothetical protein